MNYFVVMIDYGKSYPGKKGPSGFEAVVSPEHTRRQIIEEVRDILASDDRELVHVKFIDGDEMQDVTQDIICAGVNQFWDEAEADRSLPPSNIRPVSVRGLVSSDH